MDKSLMQLKQFDYYEFTAILVPGSSFLIGLAVVFPELTRQKYLSSISVGDFGLFIIAAYVCGHIIQSFANLYEWLIWIFTGRPTTWIRKDKNTLLTEDQTKAIRKKIKAELHAGDEVETQPITRQIYAYLRQRERVSRIDMFNANYGLNRAVASAALAAGIISVAQDVTAWKISAFFASVTVLTTLRMCDFGVSYARELYVEFLTDPPKKL